MNTQQDGKTEGIVERIAVPVDRVLSNAIEDYWHDKRLRSRSEAVRRLIQIGLEVESKRSSTR